MSERAQEEQELKELLAVLRCAAQPIHLPHGNRGKEAVVHASHTKGVNSLSQPALRAARKQEPSAFGSEEQELKELLAVLRCAAQPMHLPHGNRGKEAVIHASHTKGVNSLSQPALRAARKQEPSAFGSEEQELKELLAVLRCAAQPMHLPHGNLVGWPW